MRGSLCGADGGGEPPGCGHGLHLGLGWSHRCGHAHQAVLLAFLSVLSSVNTESRRLQVRGGRDPQVLTSLTCLHRSPPAGLCFLQFLFSQQTLVGNECVYSAQFKDARTHSFIRLLLRCLALWRLLNLLSGNTFL